MLPGPRSEMSKSGYRTTLAALLTSAPCAVERGVAGPPDGRPTAAEARRL